MKARPPEEANPIDPSQILRSCVDFAFDATTFETNAKKSDGDIHGKGWLTKQGRNLNEQDVLASSWEWDGAFGMFNGRLLPFHDQYKCPVGKVENIKIVPGEGLYADITIFREAGDNFIRAVKDGVLNGISIGYRVLDYDYHKKEDYRTFKQCELHEVSIVNIGANPNALLEINELKENLKDVNTNANNDRRGTMAEPNPVITLDKVEFDTFQTQQDSLKDNYAKAEKLLHDLGEKQEDLEHNKISMSEFKEFGAKMSETLTQLKNDIEIGQNGIKLLEEKQAMSPIVYNNFETMLGGHVFVRDQADNPLGGVHQDAYMLFQCPVDYAQFGQTGQDLRNLRNLHDLCILQDALGKFANPTRHRIEILNTFKDLRKNVRRFNPRLADAMEVENAMAGGNAGYGAEWIPTEMSAEFNEYQRMLPSLANKFPRWLMPKGSSGYYPFQNGKATTYLGSESTVNNASEAVKTNIATNRTTFTPKVFIAALIASYEVAEDSVVNLLNFIRTELARSLDDGLEAALVNGDDSGTHFDNATVGTHYASGAIETAFKGLRYMGVTNNAVNIETKAAATGLGSLAIANFTELKRKIGAFGERPSECLWVTSLAGKEYILDALEDAGVYGTIGYLTTGQLPPVLGSEVYISECYPNNLDSNGVYHGTNLGHTSLTYVHTKSFRIAQRRGVTLEFTKNPMTQQHGFVASARWDFGEICATGLEPVSAGINIQTA